MKILQLIQRPQLRGAEIFACQLSTALKRQGHTIVMVTVFDGDIELPYQDQVISLSGSRTRRMWDWKAWKELSRVIIREQPDVIQANSGDTLKYAVFSKIMFGWKTPLIFRNASTISLVIKSAFIRSYNAFLLRYVRMVVSVSEFSAKDFQTVFPGINKRIITVPIGVLKPANQLQQSKSFGSPFFLHIGAFTHEKNHVGLLRIFQQLRIRYPHAALGLIGEGPKKTEAEHQAAVMGLTGQVIFFGYQHNPETYLKEAQCFLLPSMIEGLPAVILEAFSCRVPVVAFNVGGVGEIVQPGKTGWLIKKNDEKAFVAAACEAIDNKAMATRYAANAFDLVEKQYHIDAIAGRFLNVYNKL